MSRARDRAAGERGFTLIEMIIAVAILGVIATSIGIVGSVMFKTLGQTQSRLKETRGPRFASVYWIPDVASTKTVNPGTDCGGAGIVTLQWTDDRSTLGVVTVTYAITTSGTETQLVRRLCTNGSTTATRTTTIAPSIATTSGAVVTCGDGTTYATCTAGDTDKSLLLKITPKSGGGTFSIDAYREVT